MIYVYEAHCGRLAWERHCSLAEYENDPTHKCPVCGEYISQILTAPRFITGAKPFRPFRSTVDGTIISSEHALREHNKRNNVVNLHDGYDERAVQGFVHKDWEAERHKENEKEVKADMATAVEKLQDGYTPTPAEYTEEIPNG